MAEGKILLVIDLIVFPVGAYLAGIYCSVIQIAIYHLGGENLFVQESKDQQQFYFYNYLGGKWMISSTPLKQIFGQSRNYSRARVGIP